MLLFKYKMSQHSIVYRDKGGDDDDNHVFVDAISAAMLSVDYDQARIHPSL